MASAKNNNTSKASAMSRDGRTGEKANEKRDLCGRGSWWLGTLKDTPSPGHYHIRDFIEEAELNPVKKTYGFKGLGRRAKIPHASKEDLLLPGAYDYTDGVQELSMRPASYSFKNCPRPDVCTLGTWDKDIDTSPCDYNLTQKPVDKIPCKHVMFRSAVQRISFLPKEGPAPGQYNIRSGPTKGITSCFKSAVPRLHCVPSRTPGPGTYEPTWPMGLDEDMVARPGQDLGLFFRVL